MEGTGSANVWGGTAWGVGDCSGSTQWIYAQQGIKVPRISQA